MVSLFYSQIPWALTKLDINFAENWFGSQILRGVNLSRTHDSLMHSQIPRSLFIWLNKSKRYFLIWLHFRGYLPWTLKFQERSSNERNLHVFFILCTLKFQERPSKSRKTSICFLEFSLSFMQYIYWKLPPLSGRLLYSQILRANQFKRII